MGAEKETTTATGGLLFAAVRGYVEHGVLVKFNHVKLTGSQAAVSAGGGPPAAVARRAAGSAAGASSEQDSTETR